MSVCQAVRMGVVGGFVVAAIGCGADEGPATGDARTDADVSDDAGAGADAAAHADAAIDDAAVSDAAPPVCPVGLDEDGDGVCDRARADWAAGAPVVGGAPRTDIYAQGEALPGVVTAGIGHSLTWPVEVSGVLLPWRPLATMLDPNATEPSAVQLQSVARGALGFGTTTEMFEWLGLARHDGSAEAMPGVAWPDHVGEGDYLGAGLFSVPAGEVLTYSCATCHTAELFGQTVFGLTNRQARANEYFHSAARFYPSLTADALRAATGANEDELALFLRAQDNLAAVGSVVPQVRGLDTSLAQVALSLARREADAWATRNPAFEARPRDNALEDEVADSKPAVWWTLKYKNRWLSDGSIVSGNPIFTNFLWNEIGRGTDLVELQMWLEENMDVVDELTVAAFATSAPRWEAFFGADSIDLGAAQRGQATFERMCASCHGTYRKGWEREDADLLDLSALLATTEVTYFEQTPVLDVGTDPQRAAGMAAFADGLNRLEVSAWMGTVVEVQTGYVPPPLDGIWARYPYLHNQSVPTLCDLLSPAATRPDVFWMGPDEDPETDYDRDCVGLPTGDATPEAWRDDRERRFDTTQPGLSNQGHESMLLDADGTPLLDATERDDLIMFLKTL